MNMPNSIVLFNLKYSPNLGDGVIALCLENELRRHFVSWDVRSIDLAGRSEWTTPTGGCETDSGAVAASLISPMGGGSGRSNSPRNRIAPTTSAILQ